MTFFVQVAADAAVVIGQLQESYLRFQLDFSQKMANAHRSLAAHLCREVLIRQLSWDDSSSRQHVRALYWKVVTNYSSGVRGTRDAPSATGF